MDKGDLKSRRAAKRHLWNVGLVYIPGIFASVCYLSGLNALAAVFGAVTLLAYMAILNRAGLMSGRYSFEKGQMVGTLLGPTRIRLAAETLGLSPVDSKRLLTAYFILAPVLVAGVLSVAVKAVLENI